MCRVSGVVAGFLKDGAALTPHPASAIHDEDVGRQAEHVGGVERQVLVVGPAGNFELRKRDSRKVVGILIFNRCQRLK